MSERTSYANGTPSWVDVSAPDVAAAKAFYTQLFGWEAIDAGPPEETGGYGMFAQDGKVVAGIGPLAPEQIEGGDKPSWTTYLAVDDADKTLTLAAENGGTVAMPAMDVMSAGRMAFLVDPTGCFVGIWQAGDHVGAQLVNEPVAVCWNEVLTTDPSRAADFYAAVFGVGTQTMDMDSDPYTMLAVDEHPVAGVAALRDPLTAVGPHWSTVFAVPDAEATVAKAKELGGSVLAEPADIPVGRVATLADPNGATFQVIKLANAT